MHYEVVISPSCAILISEYTTMAMTASIDLHSLNVSNGCRVGPGRIARTFVLLRARLNLKVLLKVLKRQAIPVHFQKLEILFIRI